MVRGLLRLIWLILIPHEHDVFEAVRDVLGLDVKPIYDKKRPGEIDHICLDSTKAAE